MHESVEMKNLSLTFCLAIAALLASVGVGIAGSDLPDCPSDPSLRRHDCFGYYSWANGHQYVGTFRYNEPDGEGTIAWVNGDKYICEMRNGKRDGRGTYITATGDRYVGQFRDGKKHGRGIYYRSSGQVLEGTWDKNEFAYATEMSSTKSVSISSLFKKKFTSLPSFRRKLIQISLASLDFYKLKIDGLYGPATQFALISFGRKVLSLGLLKEHSEVEILFEELINLQTVAISECPLTRHPTISPWHNCFGIQEFPTGERHIGEFQNDQLHGIAFTTSANNVQYAGDFRFHKKTGLGTLRRNGITLTANFINGVANGKGQKIYPNGDSYQGNFKDNLFSGKGTFVYGMSSEKWSGDKYIGDFESGNRHGTGTYTQLNGVTYVGEWRHGDESYGTLYLGNGEKYVGEFWDRKAEGEGEYTYPDGRSYIGNFKDNRNHGKGVFIHEDGSKYDGDWKYGEKHGVATFTFADGKVIKGTWIKGKFDEFLDENLPKTSKKDENENSDQLLKVSSGTGFYISDLGHIITNHHVTDGCKDMKVHSGGRVFDTLNVAEDVRNDLALLKVSETPSHVFALSIDSPYSLQEIVVAGFPFGERVSSTLKFTQGIVSSIAGLNNDYSHIQIDAALQPGNSGGPILDEYGNVVAVAVAKLSLKKILKDYGVVPENTNFGVKSSAVRNLMEGNRGPFKSPNTELISRQDLSQTVTDGTVYLTCWMTTAQIEEMRARKVLFEDLE